MNIKTESAIYVFPTSKPLLDIDETGDIGIWTNEGSLDDSFVEFVSSGPKTYGLCTLCGKTTFKSKGFTLNYSNQLIFHFYALKQLVIAR